MNEEPSGTSLDYEQCAYQEAALGAGETKVFSCTTTGKYVVIQLKKKTALTLCEVKVFGGNYAYNYKLRYYNQ